MFDMWVEDQKTKKCWRVTQDEGTKLVEEDVSRYKFYPCCPKEAPKMEVSGDYEQLSIFDYIEKECRNCKYGIQRSDFDLELHGKLAYTIRCLLIENERENYRQICHSCENWERRSE